MENEIGPTMMFFEIDVNKEGLVLHEYMNENHWMNDEIFLNNVLVAYANKLHLNPNFSAANQHSLNNIIPSGPFLERIMSNADTESGFHPNKNKK